MTSMLPALVDQDGFVCPRCRCDLEEFDGFDPLNIFCRGHVEIDAENYVTSCDVPWEPQAACPQCEAELIGTLDEYRHPDLIFVCRTEADLRYLRGDY